MKVLIIEDDQDVIDTIALSFQVGWPGVELITTGEGKKGISMVESQNPDIIILDLGLPDISGFDALRMIRSFSNIPIIILSAMMEENDIIRGLEWGADDYITKPFRKMEFLVRIKTVLRRQSPVSDEAPVIAGPLRYLPTTRQFFLDEREVLLTATESDILVELMKNAGLVVSHSSLAEAIWGDDYPNSADTIKVHIRHLREKLEVDPSSPQMIITRPGVGYSLVIKD